MLLGLGLAGVPVAATAAPIDTTGASHCQTRGFSIDRDPNGTAVRSAPRTDAAVIGHLAPLTRLSPDTEIGVEFEIIGSKDGWLLIQKGDPARDFTLDAGNAADGRGWVSGSGVGVALRHPELRTAPRSDAPLVTELKGSDWGPDSVTVQIVHACQSRYVEVTGQLMDGKRLRGWSWAPCSNQLTTCDPATVGEPR